MKKTLLLALPLFILPGCFLGPSILERELTAKIAVLEAKRELATPESRVEVEKELAEARAALAKAQAPGPLEDMLTGQGAQNLLTLAGPPGLIAGYLLMAWRRSRSQVKAMVAGIEDATTKIKDPGFNKETLYASLQAAAEQHTNAAALAKEVATLKAQIRGTV